MHPCTSVHVAHLSACENVPGQLDLGKVALSDGLEQPVVAHVRLLRLLGAPGPDASPGGARSDLLAAISVRRVLRNKTGRTLDTSSPPLTLQPRLYSRAFNQNMEVCMLCFCMFTLPALINTTSQHALQSLILTHALMKVTFTQVTEGLSERM